jgi:hypothetical protein
MASGGLEVYISVFLTLALVADEWTAHAQADLLHGQIALGIH